MKTLPRLLLCLFFLTTSQAYAQETFIPLITDKTTLFVHIDLRNADLDTLKQNWTKYSEAAMKSLRFDETSIKITLAALDRDFDKLDALARPAVEMITQKFGIQELALIVYYELSEDEDEDSENTAWMRIAVPWKGKTDSDLQMLLAALPEDEVDLDFAFPPIPIDSSGIKDHVVATGDFLFLVYDKERFEEWFAHIKPNGESAVLQAMKSLGNEENNEIKIAFSMTESIREQWLEEIKENSDDEEFTEAWINISTLVAEKFDWGAISFNNPLTNPLMKGEASPLKLTVKMRAAPDARQFRELMGPAIDNYIAGWQNEVMANDGKAPEAFFAFLRGYLRTMLPAVEEDKLVFQPPEVAWFTENFVNFFGLMAVPIILEDVF